MKKKLIGIFSVITAIIIIAAAFTACGNSKSSMDEAVYYGKGNKSFGYDYAANSAAIEESTQSYSEDSPAKTSGKSQTGLNIEDAQTRKIIRNASLDIETKKFDEFIALLDKTVNEFKGYTESSEIYGNSYYGSGNRSANLKYRIPADSLDGFIGKIGDMGNITSKSVTATDITANYTDIQARIDSLEAERKALLAILEKADKISDIIQVQDKITQVNADLDSYKRSIKNYDSLIEYSEVEIAVNEVERERLSVENPGFFTQLKEKLSENLFGIGRGFRSFAIWFISSIPYMLIIAAAAAIIILPVKKIVKNRRSRKAAKNASPDENGGEGK